jgi:hypothetical protein
LRVPIELATDSGAEFSTLHVGILVTPVDASPQTEAVVFVPDAGLPVPQINQTGAAGTVLLAWLEDIEPGLTGAVALGHIELTIDQAAETGDRWLVSVVNPGAASRGEEISVEGVDGELLIGGDLPAWSVTVSVSGGVPDTVTFGQHADATDAFDPAYDQEAPATTGNAVWFAAPDGPLAVSIRAEEHEMTWFLQVRSENREPVSLAWAVDGELPADKFLTLYEVESDGRPISGSEVNMLRRDSLGPLVGERTLALRFAGSLRSFIELHTGWNAVGLWVEPTDPAVETVFSTGAEYVPAGVRRTARVRAPLFAGRVWSWGGRAYRPLTEVHALDTVWLYALQDALLVVDGTPCPGGAVTFRRGWNLVTPPCCMSLPQHKAIVPGCFRWNAETQAYVPCDTMRPSRGHWLNADAPCTVNPQNE